LPFAAAPVDCVWVLCFVCELEVEPVFELLDERVAAPLLPADFPLLASVLLADPVVELADEPFDAPLLELLAALDELEDPVAAGVTGFGEGRTIGVGTMELSPTYGLSSRPDAL
jgi:hypothetical protein